MAFTDYSGDMYAYHPQKEDNMNNLRVWEEIGKSNYWIQNANDPLFNKKSFSECKTIEELKQKFIHGNWCLGQSFYYQNLCFINQIDGGDEWLTIRDNIPFESCTMYNIIKANEFEELIDRMLKATDEQLRKLEY